jgi:hypothetical protein
MPSQQNHLYLSPDYGEAISDVQHGGVFYGSKSTISPICQVSEEKTNVPVDVFYILFCHSKLL